MSWMPLFVALKEHTGFHLYNKIQSLLVGLIAFLVVIDYLLLGIRGNKCID